MDSNLSILCLCLCFSAICFVQCDATRTIHQYRTGKHWKSSSTKSPRKLHPLRKLDTYMPLDSSNTDPYVSSPFSLPPYESLPPFPSPENTPPYCVYPPSTVPSPPTGYSPLPPPGPTLPAPTPNPPFPNPPTVVPTPNPPFPNPPTVVPTPNPPFPNPPTVVPTPPPSFVPTPTEPVFSPPYVEPFPPPTGFVPSPRFLPPIVYPPPAVPPPPRRTPLTAMWCVAKAAVPEPIIQEAMDYACGSGADCDQIQPSGSCFMPNTLFAHASYAFNSYWQRTKVAGGKCDFGGTAILVTVDPSYDGCHFIYF